MSPTDHVRDWLMQLGARITPSMKPEEYAGRVSILAEDLAEIMPAEAFTRTSMLAVAIQHRYWPNLAELCESLQPFVAVARERQRYLALPPAQPESTEPYEPPPAPEWCYEKETRYLPAERPLNIRPPERTVEEQLAALGLAPHDPPA